MGPGPLNTWNQVSRPCSSVCAGQALIAQPGSWELCLGLASYQLRAWRSRRGELLVAFLSMCPVLHMLVAMLSSRTMESSTKPCGCLVAVLLLYSFCLVCCLPQELPLPSAAEQLGTPLSVFNSCPGDEAFTHGELWVRLNKDTLAHLGNHRQVK